MCASWRRRRSASCPCDAFDARVLHLAAQTPTATPIETSYRATRALGRSHEPAPRSRPPPATRATLLALAHCRGLDRWQVRHNVQIAAPLLLLLESIKSNGGLWRRRALGWLGRRQASRTISHTRTRRARAERRCVRQRGNNKQATAPIPLGAYGIRYVSSSILLYRSAIASFI